MSDIFDMGWDIPFNSGARSPGYLFQAACNFLSMDFPYREGYQGRRDFFDDVEIFEGRKNLKKVAEKLTRRSSGWDTDGRFVWRAREGWDEAFMLYGDDEVFNAMYPHNLVDICTVEESCYRWQDTYKLCVYGFMKMFILKKGLVGILERMKNSSEFCLFAARQLPFVPPPVFYGWLSSFADVVGYGSYHEHGVPDWVARFFAYENLAQNPAHAAKTLQSFSLSMIFNLFVADQMKQNGTGEDWTACEPCMF